MVKLALHTPRVSCKAKAWVGLGNQEGTMAQLCRDAMGSAYLDGGGRRAEPGETEHDGRALMDRKFSAPSLLPVRIYQ